MTIARTDSSNWVVNGGWMWVHSTAIYSECENYRYSLVREWDAAKIRIVFIGLNPSTATEQENDRTVDKCMRWAAEWNYGSFTMLNLFAYRATDPNDMRRHPSPVGPQNDRIILESITPDCRVIPCWGNGGAHQDAADGLLRLLIRQKVKCGGVYSLVELTKRGFPKHPCRLAYQQELVARSWRELQGAMK